MVCAPRGARGGLLGVGGRGGAGGRRDRRQPAGGAVAGLGGRAGFGHRTGGAAGAAVGDRGRVGPEVRGDGVRDVGRVGLDGARGGLPAGVAHQRGLAQEGRHVLGVHRPSGFDGLRTLPAHDLVPGQVDSVPGVEPGPGWPHELLIERVHVLLGLHSVQPLHHGLDVALALDTRRDRTSAPRPAVLDGEVGAVPLRLGRGRGRLCGFGGRRGGGRGGGFGGRLFRAAHEVAGRDQDDQRRDGEFDPVHESPPVKMVLLGDQAEHPFDAKHCDCRAEFARFIQSRQCGLCL